MRQAKPWRYMQSRSLQMESNRAVLCLLKTSWLPGIYMSAPLVCGFILIASPLKMIYKKTSSQRECSAAHSEWSKRSHEWSFVHTTHIYLVDEVTSLMDFTAWWRDNCTDSNNSKCQLLRQEVQKEGRTEVRVFPQCRWGWISKEVRFQGCLWRGLKELGKSEWEWNIHGLEMRWCEPGLGTESSSKWLYKLGRGEATGLTDPGHENLCVLYLALFSLYCRLQKLLSITVLLVTNSIWRKHETRKEKRLSWSSEELACKVGLDWLLVT